MRDGAVHFWSDVFPHIDFLFYVAEAFYVSSSAATNDSFCYWLICYFLDESLRL